MYSWNFLSLNMHAPTEQAAAVATDAAVVNAGRSYRVLLVDDDEMVNVGTTALIEDMGHIVVSVASAAPALELLEAGQVFDCVVTDHAMPGMSGFELAQLAEGEAEGAAV